MEPTGADIAELRALSERSRALVEELKGKASQASDLRRESLDSFSNDATQLIEEISAQLAEELAVDLAEQHATEQTAEYELLATEREAIDTDRALLTEEADRLAVEQAEFEASYDSSQADQQAWIEERETWESVRGEVEAELAAREEEIERRAVEVEDQLLHDERQANAESEQALAEAAEKTTVAEQRASEADERCEQLLSEAEQLTAALAETNAQLESTRQAEVDLVETQEKFDIALQDLQEHREQISLLDEELAARPEVDHAEVAEMAQLRQERDELAAQIESLPAEADGADESMELADLRSRFEMAVEDIRQLKTENADLQERLATAPTSLPSPTTEDNDWESQKRRLLASLEGEDASNDSARQVERTSIADTIQITDSVVVKKDSEIAQLQAELAAASQAEMSHVVSDEEAALLDEDAIVQAERTRLAELEKEWEEKVRTAELEISLERAKLSRAQNEIAKLKIEFETQQAPGAGGLGAAATEARHNWINKLGLGNEADK